MTQVHANDVTRSAEAFKSFSEECLRQGQISMTAACVPCAKQATPKIGRRQIKTATKKSNGPTQCAELGIDVIGRQKLLRMTM